MAGNNPRTDPFYAGPLNDLESYTSTEERYWHESSRPAYFGDDNITLNADSINIDNTEVVNQLRINNDEILDALSTLSAVDYNDDFEPVE